MDLVHNLQCWQPWADCAWEERLINTQQKGQKLLPEGRSMVSERALGGLKFTGPKDSLGFFLQVVGHIYLQRYFFAKIILSQSVSRNYEMTFLLSEFYLLPETKK